MITLRTFAAFTIAISFFCSSAQADTSAKITLVNGKSFEATVSNRSNDVVIYAVFQGQATKVVRKISRNQIASIEIKTFAPATSTVSISGRSVAQRALQAIRHSDLNVIATK
jgi:hypothetical protein